MFEVINGTELRDAIISGANNIAKHKTSVDELNIFPVPDGDTGTNMSMTMGAAARDLENAQGGIGEIAHKAASALLRGARGNSGVILSLLFRGFSKGIEGCEEIDGTELANALGIGVEAAYKAVMKPTEGTILTVAREAAETGTKTALLTNDPVEVFTAIVNQAEETLKKTKYMIVSYPLNPVCVCAPDDFYEKLIAFAKKNDIVILHDNAYSDITYTEKPGKSFLAYDGAKDVGVELYSLSKSYNLTGARISFVVGNKDIISKFRLLRSQIDYGIFYPVQYAAIAALTGPDDFIEQQRQEYGRRNRALCGGLRRIGWNVPDSQGTMFVWAKIPDGYDSSADFCMKLMEKTGVIVTPGSAFGSGGEGYVRMALVVDENMIDEILHVLDESGIFR